MEEELVRAVDEIGSAEGRGRSEIVREALESWLKRKHLEAKVRRECEGYRNFPVTADEFEPVLRAQTWPK